MKKIIQLPCSPIRGYRKNERLKIFSFSVLFLMLVSFAPQLKAQDNAAHGAGVLIYENGEVEWKEGPASLEKGAQFAVLEGNPAEEGYFNLRLKLPDGFRIAPHSHPAFERITVISGNFLLGHGETVDSNAAQRLGPGSYVSMPKGMVHFAIAEGETVVQLATMGPWKINYVNVEDDPRNKKK